MNTKLKNAPADGSNAGPYPLIDTNAKVPLDQVQANILMGHGRDHTVNVFLRITDVADFRAALAKVSPTSMLTQLDQRALFKSDKIPGGLIRCVLFSGAGLKVLKPDLAGLDPIFRAGMGTRFKKLDDPDPKKDELDFSAPHVLVLLAHDEQRRLDQAYEELLESLGSSATVVAVEFGHALRNADNEGVEHFGYVDGRSQPLYFQDELCRERIMEGLRPCDAFQWDPTGDLARVLIADPLTGAALSASYFVFRKLEQNVKGFKAREAELACRLQLHEEVAEQAGAMMVGRFEDGTALVIAPKERGLPISNNFSYKDDATGRRCPLHAHIRLTNPREGSNAALMARRGIPYGTRPDFGKPDEEFPDGGVGLLFQAYMANIGEQFEKAQIEANANNDSVIGQKLRAAQVWSPTDQDWPRHEFKVGQFVTMRGGEYFIALSVGGTRQLLAGDGNGAAVKEAGK